MGSFSESQHPYSNNQMKLSYKLSKFTLKSSKTQMPIPELKSLYDLSNNNWPKPQRVYYNDSLSGIHKLESEGYRRIKIYTVIEQAEEGWMGFFQNAYWRIYPLPEGTVADNVILVGGKPTKSDISGLPAVKFPLTKVVKIGRRNPFTVRTGTYLAVKTGGEFMTRGETEAEMVYSVLVRDIN